MGFEWSDITDPIEDVVEDVGDVIGDVKESIKGNFKDLNDWFNKNLPYIMAGQAIALDCVIPGAGRIYGKIAPVVAEKLGSPAFQKLKPKEKKEFLKKNGLVYDEVNKIWYDPSQPEDVPAGFPVYTWLFIAIVFIIIFKPKKYVRPGFRI